MNVYTYYQYVPYFGDSQAPIVEAWCKNWRKNGWNPVVLDDSNACLHPQWANLTTRKINEFPSRNPEGYDLACWARWLALDVMRGGVMTDYDVANNGLAPEDVILGPPVILDQFRVPCAVAADERGARAITDRLMSHVAAPRDGHYSDMMFFQDSNWPHIRACREFGELEWEAGKMVHFSSRACGLKGKSKLDLMRWL